MDDSIVHQTHKRYQELRLWTEWTSKRGKRTNFQWYSSKNFL